MRYGWNCRGHVVDFLLCYKRHYSWFHPWRYEKVYFLPPPPLKLWNWYMLLELSCGVTIFHLSSNLLWYGYYLLCPTTTSIMSVGWLFTASCGMMLNIYAIIRNYVWCVSFNLENGAVAIEFVIILWNIILLVYWSLQKIFWAFSHSVRKIHYVRNLFWSCVIYKYFVTSIIL